MEWRQILLLTVLSVGIGVNNSWGMHIPSVSDSDTEENQSTSTTVTVPVTAQPSSSNVTTEEFYLADPTRKKVGFIVRELQNYKKRSVHPFAISGPKGAGKESLASYISKQSNCLFKTIRTSDIISKYKAKTFDNWVGVFFRMRRPTLMYIKNLHHLDVNDESYQQIEESLWDTIKLISKEAPNVTFAFSTPSFDSLPERSSRKCLNRSIELSSPNPAIRKQLIEFFAKKHGCTLAPEVVTVPS